MLGVEAEVVLVRLADSVGVQSAKLPIGAGITEIESELACLHLDRHGIGTGRVQIDVSPRFDSENTESHDFRADEQQGSNNQALSATGKALDFSVGTGVGVLPNEDRSE